jgi:cobalt-zinc-cadmium efflux system membrane fusion protein
LLVLCGLTGCRHQQSPTSEAEPSPDFQREGNAILVSEGSPLRSRLVLEMVKSEPVRRMLSVPAAIEADPQRFARVFPPVAGRVVRLHVQLGDPVTYGQVLATVHSPDFIVAQSDYLKARSTLQMAQRQLERQNDLQAHKVAAQREVEQAQRDFEAAKNDVASTIARLRAYGLDPNADSLGQPLRLCAPLAGRVVDMAAALGEFRSDNNAALMTIADLSRVWVTASVPEKDVHFVVLGQEVQAMLPAYPGETFTGKVEAIGDLLDPDTRAVKVRAVVPNPQGRLKPGMFATVTLIGLPETLITVPTTAVLEAGGRMLVYEQTQAGRFEPREVVLGSYRGNRSVILKGLSDGVVILAEEGVLFQQ